MQTNTPLGELLMRHMWRWPVLGILMIAVVVFIPTHIASQSDTPDLVQIHRLIDRYGAAEAAGDLKAQGELMTKDRLWVNPRRGRRLDNARNMEIQQAMADNRRKSSEKLKLFVDDKERIIRFLANGTVAIASFYRFYTGIVPEDAPEHIKEEYGSAQAPELMSLVLEKRNGEWKIVFTHTSPTWQ
jgi:hypothetical protein